MSQTYEQLKLENQLCFPLYACSRKIINAYTPCLKPLGLTYTQYLVFMVLWEKEAISVGELGERLHLDAGTLSPLLKHLEEKGYIRRERLKADERVTQLQLLDKGRELMEACKEIPFRVAPVVSHLQEKEIRDLYRLLYKILEDKE